jgi:hypothetical protein
MRPEIVRPWLIAAAIALLLAILAIWPYAYYRLLRWFVCGVAIAGIASVVKAGGWRPVALGILALVFNPIGPVYLAKSDWIWIDAGAAGVLPGIALGPPFAPARA